MRVPVRQTTGRLVRTAISIQGERVRYGEHVDVAVPWWSFTKLVVATAAMKLVETGSLELDRPLEGRRYTLRQLLQHEAGLPDYGWLHSYHSAIASGCEPWAADEIITRTIEAYPPWAPGTRWAYSNIGFYYVGELIVGAAGKSLGEALDVLALAPAGVRNVRHARFKADLDHTPMGPGNEYDPCWVLHGLLVGSIAEAATFLHALLSGTVVHEVTLAEMLKVRLLPQFGDNLWDHPAYGLGMMGSRNGVAAPCGHSGEGPGSGIAVFGKVLDAEVCVAGCWEFPGTSRGAEKVVLELLEQA